MNISWLGQSAFLIKIVKNLKKEIKILTDPFSPQIGLKWPNLEADIVLVSHQHQDHNFIQGVKGQPFIIQELGEYEVKGIFFRGILAFHDNNEGKDRGSVIIFTLETEGLKLCHLSDLGQKELTEEQLEKIGPVDILFVPVGGFYTIDADQAKEIIGQLNPKIVIPMHYQLPKLKFKLKGLDVFLNVMGKKSIEPLKKLKIKSESLPDQMELIILQP